MQKAVKDMEKNYAFFQNTSKKIKFLTLMANFNLVFLEII